MFSDFTSMIIILSKCIIYRTVYSHIEYITERSNWTNKNKSKRKNIFHATVLAITVARGIMFWGCLSILPIVVKAIFQDCLEATLAQTFTWIHNELIRCWQSKVTVTTQNTFLTSEFTCWCDEVMTWIHHQILVSKWYLIKCPKTSWQIWDKLY